MNRNIASVLTLGTVTAAAAFAVAAIASGNAYADDITIDKTPFVSTKTRAEVKAELMSGAALMSNNEWDRQYNKPTQINSAVTRQQVRADYIASRQYVSAMNGEDSGSAFFTKSAGPGSATTTAMGAPAR